MRGPKIGIVLQARTGSTRLPGKVLRPIQDKPMIGWIIDRLLFSQKADQLIVATTTSTKDDPLAEFVQALDVACFRGKEEDVLDRFRECAIQHELDLIVRATADNPFVDPFECDRLIDLYSASDVDYACAFPEYGSGHPIGVGLEIFSRGALEASWKEGKDPVNREHVNEFLLAHPERFGRAVLKAPAPKAAPELNLTVDSEDQFQAAEKLYKEYFSSHTDSYLPVEWVIKNSRQAKP